MVYLNGVTFERKDPKSFMFLWKTIAYGPVYSRRLGHSLGLNVLPSARKVCNFDCVYCECGLNDKFAPKQSLPTVEEFETELQSALTLFSEKNQPIDNMTFAGNGEPTLHPNFLDIIQATRKLRDRFYPRAEIAVLTDAATLHNEKVFTALQLADKPIMKIDAGSEEMFQKINQPETKITLTEIIERLKKFHGKLYVQSLFLKGTVNGIILDNTTDDEIELMLKHYRSVNPEFVMVYSIDRETPYPTLVKLDKSELESIAHRIRAIGIDAECYS